MSTGRVERVGERYLSHRMSKLPPKLPSFVPRDVYTLEQYLAIEAATGKRYEYHDGELVSVESMAGGSYMHAVIAGNFVREIGNALIAQEQLDARLAGCNATTSDLRIAVDGGKRYLYADAVVVCGAPKFDEEIPTAVVNPIVVAEVVSPSSDHYDKHQKFDFYGALPSLREYIILEQDDRRVEVRQRPDANAAWSITVTVDAAGSVPLPALGVELPMAGLYRGWARPEQGRRRIG